MRLLLMLLFLLSSNEKAASITLSLDEFSGNVCAFHRVGTCQISPKREEIDAQLFGLRFH